MSATLILTRPLCDTRPRRGKHRTRRPLGVRLLAVHARARGACTLAAMCVGALAAAVLS